ncbi:MAG: hypothetical protein JST04_16185 [Bdellovibrionales bacterium]|nr:hypothetical protein [Bdellovibrionales bacterium]
MSVRSLVLLFALLGFSAGARADILTLRQDVVDPGGSGDRVEVTTFLTEDEADRTEVIARLRTSLEEAAAANPKLLTHFEEIDEPTGRAPSAESPAGKSLRAVVGERTIVKRTLSTKIRDALHFRYPDWFVKKSRIVFSVARGITNGTVAAWSLHASQHLPFPVAVATGVLTGTMSGSLQYFNEAMQGYLTKSIAAKWAKGETLQKGIRFVESYFRWYMLEIGFTVGVELALTALGHPPVGTIKAITGHLLGTALAAVAAQGTWEVAIGRVTKKALAATRSLRAKKIIRLRSDFVTLALSALSVTGMVGKISNMSFGDTIFWGMGITGGLYTAKLYFTEWQCRKNMSKDRPRIDDPMSSAPANADDQSAPDDAA